MSDFDTRRIGEIMALQDQIDQLKGQLEQYKADAIKWKPQVSTELNPNTGIAKVSLSFGGKAMSATVTLQALLENAADASGIATAITERLCSTIVMDQLKPLVQPKIEQLVDNAQSVNKAGRW